MNITPNTLFQHKKSYFQPIQYPAQNLKQENLEFKNVLRYIIPFSALLPGAQNLLDCLPDQFFYLDQIQFIIAAFETNMVMGNNNQMIDEAQREILKRRHLGGQRASQNAVARTDDGYDYRERMMQQATDASNHDVDHLMNPYTFMSGSRRLKKIKIYKNPLLKNSQHADRSVLFHPDNVVGIQYTFVIQDPDFSFGTFLQNRLIDNIKIAKHLKSLNNGRKRSSRKLPVEMETDLNRPEKFQCFLKLDPDYILHSISLYTNTRNYSYLPSSFTDRQNAIHPSNFMNLDTAQRKWDELNVCSYQRETMQMLDDDTALRCTNRQLNLFWEVYPTHFTMENELENIFPWLISPIYLMDNCLQDRELLTDDDFRGEDLTRSFITQYHLNKDKLHDTERSLSLFRDFDQFKGYFADKLYNVTDVSRLLIYKKSALLFLNSIMLRPKYMSNAQSKYFEFWTNKNAFIQSRASPLQVLTQHDNYTFFASMKQSMLDKYEAYDGVHYSHIFCHRLWVAKTSALLGTLSQIKYNVLLCGKTTTGKSYWAEVALTNRQLEGKESADACTIKECGSGTAVSGLNRDNYDNSCHFYDEKPYWVVAYDKHMKVTSKDEDKLEMIKIMLTKGIAVRQTSKAKNDAEDNTKSDNYKTVTLHNYYGTSFVILCNNELSSTTPISSRFAVFFVRSASYNKRGRQNSMMNRINHLESEQWTKLQQEDSVLIFLTFRLMELLLLPKVDLTVLNQLLPFFSDLLKKYGGHLWNINDKARHFERCEITATIHTVQYALYKKFRNPENPCQKQLYEITWEDILEIKDDLICTPEIAVFALSDMSSELADHDLFYVIQHIATNYANSVQNDESYVKLNCGLRELAQKLTNDNTYTLLNYSYDQCHLFTNLQVSCGNNTTRKWLFDPETGNTQFGILAIPKEIINFNLSRDIVDQAIRQAHSQGIIDNTDQLMTGVVDTNNDPTKFLFYNQNSLLRRQ